MAAMDNKKFRNQLKIYLYISLALVLLILIAEPSLCQHRDHIDPSFGTEWVIHTPGKWYTLTIMYPSAEESLEGNDVAIALSAVPKSQVSLSPIRDELGSKFKSESSFTIEVTPNATAPIIVLGWETENEESTVMGNRPSGTQKIIIPK
jgi:hypothetical protein